jgi:hypothetical protein
VYRKRATAIAALACAFLAACATPDALDKPMPADSGTIVLSLGAYARLWCSNVSLWWQLQGDGALATAEEFQDRPVGTNRPLQNAISVFDYVQHNIFRAIPRDFDGHTANGVVLVRDARAGNYEIVKFLCTRNLPLPLGLESLFSAREDVAIPFTVRSNEVTYLGEFLVGEVPGTAITTSFTSFAYLIVSDRAERDLEIARSRAFRIRTLPVSKQVINWSGAKTPLIRNAPYPGSVDEPVK